MSSDFIQHLIEKKLLSQNQFSDLQKESEKEGKSIEELIIDKGIISERDLFRKKSDFFQIPLRRIFSDQIPNSVLEEISEEAARHYKIIPLKREGDLLEVGMVNPEDFSSQSALDFIAKQKGVETRVYLIVPSDFNEVLKKYRALKEEVRTAIEELEKEEEIEKKTKEKNYYCRKSDRRGACFKNRGCNFAPCSRRTSFRYSYRTIWRSIKGEI